VKIAESNTDDAPLATETRDERVHRAAIHQRHSDAEIRRLYEPAPSPELRAAATEAVDAFFLGEMARRLDAIAEAAKELGGAVGEQIRALAGAGDYRDAKAETNELAAYPLLVIVTEESAPHSTDFLRFEALPVIAPEPPSPPEDGKALPPTYCRRCPGTPRLMTWVKADGYKCPRCDGEARRSVRVVDFKHQEVTRTGEVIAREGEPS
jgi:hypothetical protein